MTLERITTLASRVLRGVFVGLGLMIGGFFLFVIIAWDSDPYLARDKYEHFKLALFGEWNPSDRCERQPDIAECETLNAFEEALERASDFTFFRMHEVAGTDLSVHTGIQFATARDVVDGNVASQWCYVGIPQGGTSTRIELATQSADEPPVYKDLSGLDESALAGSGLNLSRLSDLAQSHCDFETN